MDNHSLSPPRGVYQLSRSKDDGDDAQQADEDNDDAEEEYTSVATSSSYQEFGRTGSPETAISLVEGGSGRRDDATAAVHEMHLALLFLLSHPEEFILPADLQMADWNTHHPSANHHHHGDNDESLMSTAGTTVTNHSITQLQDTLPLPCLVFADDAEIVLPQAHTASQLFGVETHTGMELEAAAGIPNICKLFRRWLAILPGADHLHLIDPPGITVMRIAGNRYRVTAAHRCIWTWQNELANWSGLLSCGDLVTLTIVDVFETDNQGKLLSYCPTFDNRAVQKVDRNLHAIRQHTASLKAALEKSPFLKALAYQATHLAISLKQKVDDVVYGKSSNDGDDDDNDDEGSSTRHSGGLLGAVPSFCLGEDDDDDRLERHEV